MTHLDQNVWAVVVTYNGIKWIQACLQSILSNNPKPQIIVVDNNSSDGTTKFIADTFPEVNLIASKENLGFGRANNVGIKIALQHGAEYICLVNQDAKLDALTITHMVEVATQHQDYGILSPIHLTYEGGEIDPHFIGYITKDAPEFLSDLLFNRVKEIYEIPFAPAALWFVRNTAFKIVGGFDPLFFMYGEDLDLCKRMQHLGWKIGLVPHAIGYHWHGGTIKSPESIQRYSKDLYWQMIIMLKNNESLLAKSLLSMFRYYITQILRSAVYLNYREIVAVCSAWINVLSKLKQVSNHRRLCMQKQGIFLSE